MIVVDTNIIAYLLIKGENTELVKKLLKLDPEWISPVLWRSEFRNVVSMYIRYKYFDVSEAQFIVNKAEELMKEGEFQVQSRDVIELAAESGCSAYDCEYVALARDADVKLITTDRELLKAFPGIADHPQNVISNSLIV